MKEEDPILLGPESELAILMDTWGNRLLQFAGTYARDRVMAQDVVQDAFLRIWRFQRRHPGRPVNPGWLYTVTRNCARDHVKREPRPRPLRDASTPLAADDIETRVAVQAVLDHMAERDRQCLWLFYYARWPIADIATALGLSEPAVKQRLYRARHRFRELWGGDADA